MADVITNRIPHELSRNITHVIISDAFVATNVIVGIRFIALIFTQF